MKYLMLWLLLPMAGIAQSHIPDQQEVRNTIIKMFDGLSDRDPQKIQACTTGDFLLLENGAVWNNDSLAAKMNKLKIAVVHFNRVNKLDFLSVRVNRNGAWAAFNNSAEITMDDKHRSVSWLESAVLVRTKGDWKIQLFHSTVLHDQTK